MRRFWPRLLKSVLPVTIVCAGAGYLYAIAAGTYIADGRDDGANLRDTLVWRVPFAMAFWGGGFTLFVEFFRYLWAPKKPIAKSVELANPQLDAEKLLLQLLEQAEQAEESRRFPVPTDRLIPPPSTEDSAKPPVTDTPLPSSLPSMDSQTTTVR